MCEATQAGEQLMSHCTDEDKDLVREKTEKLLQCYKTLRDQAKEKKQKADDAAKLSREFYDTKDQLITWCEGTAGKLEAAKGEGENVQMELLKVCSGFTFFITFCLSVHSQPFYTCRVGD